MATLNGAQRAGAESFQSGYRAGMYDVLAVLNTGLADDDTTTLDAVRDFVETGLGIR